MTQLGLCPEEGRPCPPSPYDAAAATDGLAMGPWIQWSYCSASCGSGVRIRFVHSVRPNLGQLKLLTRA